MDFMAQLMNLSPVTQHILFHCSTRTTLAHSSQLNSFISFSFLCITYITVAQLCNVLVFRIA